MFKTCIFTVIKNEQEYLKEWIDYHLDLGINHIFIFEDIDSESHKELCSDERVSLNSILNILENKEEAIDLKLKKEVNPQHYYFKKGLSFIKQHYNYDWCFAIDVDEFITLEHSTLNDTLSLYQNFDAFLLQWKCFGANGRIKKSNKGLIETYTKEMEGKVPNMDICLTKTCFNLKKYQESFFFNLHQPSDACNFCKSDTYRYRFTPCFKHIYLRHYITKSWEDYIYKRYKRGFCSGATRTLDFFFEINPDMKHLKEELVKQIPTLVVLPYSQRGSQGEELDLALTGWKKFCQFDYHFVVIGEFDQSLQTKYPWVEFIYSKQLPKKEGQYNQHLDVQYCMRKIMDRYKNMFNGFIWITDDNYAIKPFTLEDITTIHYHSDSFKGYEKSPTSYWNHDKWKTRQLLDKENLPHINYTTHYPCWLEFSKLREIQDKFNMLEESYVLEDIYFNYFTHSEPILDNNIRLGIWDQKIFKEEFQKALDNPDIKFMCNSVKGWSKELEKSLKLIYE